MDQQRILFVDDEEQIRRLLSTFLTRRGYEVTTAVDGMQARQLLKVELKGSDGSTIRYQLG